MIMVTGGAGFIGSNLHAALVRDGHETVVVDRLGDRGKWRNLARHAPARIVAPEQLDAFLHDRPPLTHVVHMGAISETTASDGDLVWRTNVDVSLGLWRWCAEQAVPFIYASSAATYGDGTLGFDDDASIAHLRALRPLNLYGWTKNAFDLNVAQMLAHGEPAPPQWAGLKFFNVYGPNEYHKDGMISVVRVKHQEITAGGSALLFRSGRAGIADGEQRRDFIWVGDVVDVILWLIATPSVSGLFNLGTGQSRSYLDVARAVCAANGAEPRIAFVDLPERLAGQYQYFTQARMERLRQAGYTRPFTSLEDGVRRYVQDHLTQPDPYL